MRTLIVPTLILLATGLRAEDAIIITATPEEPLRTIHPLTGPTADPGASLRAIPGLDAIRMGGLGLDPVLRGQSASRLLVEVDGACPHGGCPNRMDPPTSYAPAGATLVDIMPGGLSVRDPGAPLGIVRLQRQPLDFKEGETLHAEADARYGGNGAAREAGAMLAVGRPWGFLRGTAHTATSGNYHDGSGNEVFSSYRSAKGGGTVGWTPGTATRIELSHDVTRERDVAYAGAGMDAITSDDATTRLRLTHHGEGRLASLAIDLYASRVEHRMDNFSLRTPPAMLMSVPTTSDTSGGRLSAEIATPAGLLGVGADGEILHQDARRLSGATPATVTALNSVMWPDARVRRFGAWADITVDLNPQTRVVPGVRYDVVRSNAAEADVDPPGAPLLSPAALYAAYYGTHADGRSEHLAGASLRLERDWATDGRIALALSRQQRAADPTERFIAANGMPASSRWVGNPGLNAETHQQVQIVASQGRSGGDRWRAEAWIDRVHDYIRRDRARGQDGVLLADGATIYRNGEVLLGGVQGDGAAGVTDWLELSAQVAWTSGQDLDTGLPLQQLPPLSGQVSVRAHHDRWESSLVLRWSARATRIDSDTATGSGLDAGETPSWAVLDWSFAWRPDHRSELSVGVANLLDRTYAEHLNKPSSFDSTVLQVNEPGRSVWAAAAIRF